MNKRQWKKACKRAALVLLRDHPELARDLVPAKGDELVDAPRKYRPPGRPRSRADRHMARFYAQEAPKGAPLLWERASYEYDEWDAITALEVLNRIRLYEAMAEDYCREYGIDPAAMMDDAA